MSTYRRMGLKQQKPVLFPVGLFPAAVEPADAKLLRYHCRDCRTFLFESASLSPAHACPAADEAEAAAAEAPSDDRGDGSILFEAAPQRCTSLFLDEPSAWMGDVRGSAGRLQCPGRAKKKCGAKIGAWNWKGLRCSCGEWVAPCFQVVATNVDAKEAAAPPVEAAAAAPEAPELEVSGDLGVSLQWFAYAAPPCVVVVCCADPDSTRAALENRWAGRFRKDGGAWFFVDADSGQLRALLGEVRRSGVPMERVAVGGVGDRCAAALRAAYEEEPLGATFALAPAHSDVVEPPPAFAAPSLLCAVPGVVDGHGSTFKAAHCFNNLEADELTDGAVRTLCTWLNETLPGHDINLNAAEAR